MEFALVASNPPAEPSVTCYHLWSTQESFVVDQTAIMHILKPKAILPRLVCFSCLAASGRGFTSLPGVGSRAPVSPLLYNAQVTDTYQLHDNGCIKSHRLANFLIAMFCFFTDILQPY
jgi:hypothetical protein